MIKSPSSSPSAVAASRSNVLSPSPLSLPPRGLPDAYRADGYVYRADGAAALLSPHSDAGGGSMALDLPRLDAALAQLQVRPASPETPEFVRRPRRGTSAAPPGVPSHTRAASGTAAVPTDDAVCATLLAGNISDLAHLLARGANPNARDANGTPALLLAVRAPSQACVEMLLSLRVDVNAADAEGVTALHLAAARADMRLLSMLCARPGINLTPRLRGANQQTPRELADANHVRDSALYLARMEAQQASLGRP